MDVFSNCQIIDQAKMLMDHPDTVLNGVLGVIQAYQRPINEDLAIIWSVEAR